MFRGSDVYTSITSSNPIMLAQFSKSMLYTDYEADPALIIIPPTDQYLDTYRFTPPKRIDPDDGSEVDYNNFLTLITDKVRFIVTWHTKSNCCYFHCFSLVHRKLLQAMVHFIITKT